MKRVVLPSRARRSINKSINTPKSPSSAHPPASVVAFAFDIDGVLVRGGKTIESAGRVLNDLVKNQTPFLLVSNGGGVPEAKKAAALSEKLGVKLRGDQIILAHTPMKALVSLYSKQHVLVAGKRYALMKDLLRGYGFEHVITSEEYHHRDPLCYPDLEVAKVDGSNPPISAAFVLTDPLFWGRDIQVITDIIRQHAARSPSHPLPIYSACADLEYSAEHPEIRFGAGAFGIALDALAGVSLGKKHYNLQVFGKPHAVTFRYAEALLDVSEMIPFCTTSPHELHLLCRAWLSDPALPFDESSWSVITCRPTSWGPTLLVGAGCQH